uniref:(California timema) hypothetical protein n=1 Tax=Timema californicum TaxID=61474 RepID=A0A7R9J4J0_TIMCA|nr:unnamed protein product [Timema californicum]
MMYACGDNPFPHHSSAYLIEDIVKEQLHHILCKAVEVCDLRGTKVIQLEELIFLMRKNRVKIHRLLSYLRVKDMKNMNGESVNVDSESVPLEELKQKNTEYQTCLSFLKKIDNTGELTDMNYQPFDKIMYERNMRADKTAQSLDEANYMIFTQARRASFVHSKNAEKFTDWVQSFWKSPESPKIHAKSNIILGYLSKETVAEIVDLAMLVRKDASVNSVDPLGQGFYRSSPGTSADSASNQTPDSRTRRPAWAHYPLLDTPAHSPRNTQLSPVIIAIWVTVNSLESSISRILAQN